MSSQSSVQMPSSRGATASDRITLCSTTQMFGRGADERFSHSFPGPHDVPSQQAACRIAVALGESSHYGTVLLNRLVPSSLGGEREEARALGSRQQAVVHRPEHPVA
jgi:hypothetical protein